MCGSPKIVRQDPEADAKAAAEKAMIEANMKKANRRTANNSSVLSGAFDANTKTKLGGG